jgi:hypothetical protein
MLHEFTSSVTLCVQRTVVLHSIATQSTLAYTQRKHDMKRTNTFKRQEIERCKCDAPRTLVFWLMMISIAEDVPCHRLSVTCDKLTLATSNQDQCAATAFGLSACKLDTLSFKRVCLVPAVLSFGPPVLCVIHLHSSARGRGLVMSPCYC